MQGSPVKNVGLEPDRVGATQATMTAKLLSFSELPCSKGRTTLVLPPGVAVGTQRGGRSKGPALGLAHR